MSRRRLEELAERVAALETEGASAELGRVDARLAAIEDAIRRLGKADPEAAGSEESMRWCNETVAEHVPAGARLAVAATTSTVSLALDHWPTAAFGQQSSSSGDYGIESGLAAIAHLEAQRASEGIDFLLVPAHARAWLDRVPGFAEHLKRSYRAVADDLEAGLLIDVGVREADEERERTLAEELERLTDGDRAAPILDWTELDLAPVVPGANVFVSPAEHGELPHLDGTIDVVVVEDPERLSEARRVASSAVLRVGAGENGGIELLEVEEVRTCGADRVVPVRVVVADADDRWRARVEEALSGREAVEVVASQDPWSAVGEADVSVVLEPGVLPLPGCLDALVDSLDEDEGATAATAKLLAADGSLEAAGRTVFADGSAESIAGGSRDVEAAWHEFVRPVCAASGLLAVRGPAARHASRPHGTLLGASAELWSSGYGLAYRPSAHAVRALNGAEPKGSGEDAGIAAWEPVLPARPCRPAELDEPEWRMLLARDDPAEAWR